MCQENTAKNALVLAAIVALAALVRVHHLADVSCNFDESFCWKLTTFGFSQAWHRSALDNHPPLFFYLLLGWSSAFGDSVRALRLLSVCLGLAGVGAAYLFVRQIESQSARERSGGAAFPALLAAALMALSPFQIDWSQQIRMYALGSSLTLLSSWLLLRALEAARPRWQDFGFYAVAAAALAYTHYFGLFILAAQFLYACWRCCSTGDLSTAAHAVCAFCAVAALWLPWLPEFLHHRDRVAQSFWTGEFEGEQLARVCYQMFAVGWTDIPPGRWISWAAGAACLLFSTGAAVFGGNGLLLIGLGALVTLGGAGAASVLSRNIIVPQYFIFCHALLICGVAIVAARLPGMFREGVCLALFLALSAECLAHERRREARADRPGMIAAMAYLAAVREPDEPVLVSNPMVQTTALIHAVRPESVHVLSTSGSFPYFQGTAVMHAREYLSPRRLQRLSARRLWVVDTVHWNGGAPPVQLPDAWVDVAEEAFPEWFSPSCQIVVRRCERRPSMRGPASRREQGGRPRNPPNATNQTHTWKFPWQLSRGAVE